MKKVKIILAFILSMCIPATVYAQEPEMPDYSELFADIKGVDVYPNFLDIEQGEIYEGQYYAVGYGIEVRIYATSKVANGAICNIYNYDSGGRLAYGEVVFNFISDTELEDEAGLFRITANDASWETITVESTQHVFYKNEKKVVCTNTRILEERDKTTGVFWSGRYEGTWQYETEDDRPYYTTEYVIIADLFNSGDYFVVSEYYDPEGNFLSKSFQLMESNDEETDMSLVHYYTAPSGEEQKYYFIRYDDYGSFFESGASGPPSPVYHKTVGNVLGH